MIQRFEIAGRLPGLNEIIDAARLSKFASSTQKKLETSRCAWCARAAKLSPISSPAVFRFIWIEPNAQRDPDNIAAGSKFILDGLVAIGIIPDDDRRFVRTLEHSFPDPSPRQPRVEITIETIDDDEPEDAA